MKTSKDTNRSRFILRVKSVIGLLFVFLITLILFIVALGNAVTESRIKAQRAAEETVNRAAVTCFALEGFYPESYGYLKAHYSIKLNEDFYAVHYIAFASNLMPEITIVRR